MESSDLILGLFFSDENNIVYEDIKFSKELSEERMEELKMLSFKFLGPVFLTSASSRDKGWSITFLESTLTFQKGKISDTDIIQSFFNINSSIETEDGTNNLFAIIGSPYTEDIKIISDAINYYIHPGITQNKNINEHLLGRKFRFSRFIKEELHRGINLINYSLGSSRKMYWEETRQYYCMGLIVREIGNDMKSSKLYTFNKDDPTKTSLLHLIPSYYVMSIMPDYYENIIIETLKLFEKPNISPNIRRIDLKSKDKKVVYLEEFLIKNDVKKSYGVILIADDGSIKGAKNFSFFRKNMRETLDKNRPLEEFLIKINPLFKNIEWKTDSNENLNNIKEFLDN